MLKCKIIRTISYDAVCNLCAVHVWFNNSDIEDCVEIAEMCNCKNLNEDQIMAIARCIIAHTSDLSDDDIRYIAESIFYLSAERIQFYDE